MFASYISVALLAASSVSGLVVPRAQPTPAKWWVAGLEDYRVYNTRYNTLGCAQKHNTSFFDACCHPLRKTQTLASRPAICNLASPSGTPTSTLASATPAPTADDGDDDCDDDDVPSSTLSSALPTPTDDGEDDCDDDEPEPNPSSSASSAAPTPTDDGSDDDDCDDDEPSPSSTFSSAVPTSTDNGDDDDCEPCEEGDDDCEEIPVTTATSSVPKTTSSVPKTTFTSASSTSVSSSSSKATLTPTPTPTPTPKPATTAKPSSTVTSTKAATSTFTGDITKQTTGTVTGGHATFFYQGGVKGACEKLHTDDDLVAAIDYRRYGYTGKVSPLCGEKIRVTNKNNGKSVDVVIADACPTCGVNEDVDLSYKAFTTIATEDEGYVPIEYTFIGKGQL